MDAKGVESSLRRFQSSFLLPTARSIFVVVATGCLLAILLGIIALLYFQFQTQQSPSQVAIPEAYSPGARTIDASIITERLAPPTNIRFLVTLGSIRQPLTGQEVLGHFDADSTNKLADFPGDFDIVGGTDVALFTKTAANSFRAGLAPSADLSQQINKLLPDVKSSEQHTYNLKVIAHDEYGNQSAPTDVNFNLTFSAPLVASVDSAPATKTAPPNAGPSEVTPLQALAREIATIDDPKHTPEFFDAYNRALGEPRVCGSNDGDTQFFKNYRQAFDLAKGSLTAANLPAFYIGLCDAWRRAIAAEAQARAANGAARNQAIQQNAAAEAQATVARSIAVIMRSATLVFLGGAVTLFLVISMYLAFLAMENHLKALREDVEAFLGEKR